MPSTLSCRHQITAGSMAVHVAINTAAVFVILTTAIIKADVFHQKYEYKYSFKGPYLAQRDGSVPFWEYGGSTIASEENARITPSLKSKKGYMWTKNQTNFDWWMIEFTFRVSGRGRVGADGLAFWYTEQKSMDGTGQVFGSADKWRGLGLFFDSFDNDNKHNNPYIMGIVNDGTQAFDHQNDGVGQQLAGCLRDYRNKPFPVKVKVEYYKNTLTVLFHNGMTNNDLDFEMCFRSENVFLPKVGYFGLSAATGGLADDHDVLKFLTYSLTSPEELASQQRAQVGDNDREKLSKEFEEFRTRLEQQKQDFRKDHPDKDKDMDGNPDEWFENDQQRELRQIFAGQSHMFEILRELHRKMDEIIGRQERTLSLIGSSGVAPVHGQTASPGGQQPIMIDTIRRQEVEAVLANQMEVLGNAREIKAFVTEIHQKSNTIISNQGKGSFGYDVQAFISEMKDQMNVLKKEMSTIAAKSTAPCPVQSANCISTSVFLIFMAIHLILIFGYFIYRDSKEAQAKKFY